MIGDPYCGQFHDTHISNFRWFTTEVGARGASEVTMVGGGNSICGVAAGVCKEREDPWNSSYDPDDPSTTPTTRPTARTTTTGTATSTSGSTYTR